MIFFHFRKRMCLNKCVTLDEKLALIGSKSDLNGDRIVSFEELRRSFADDYDNNSETLLKITFLLSSPILQSQFQPLVHFSNNLIYLLIYAKLYFFNIILFFKSFSQTYIKDI